MHYDDFVRIGIAALVKNNVIGSITKLKKNNSVYFLQFYLMKAYKQA